MQKPYSEGSYHNVHPTNHTSRCIQINPHEIIAIMIEHENVLLRHHGSLCTDLLSLTSYTAPAVRCLGFPLLSYFIHCCLMQSRERKPVNKRHTFA